MHERIRDAMLDRWGRMTTTRPRTVLATCLVVAAASITLAVTSLQFKPDRSELVSRERDWNRKYLDYKTNVERWGDLIVVLDGGSLHDQTDAVARELANHLRSHPGVRNADSGFQSREAPRLYLGAEGEAFETALSGYETLKRVAEAANVNAAAAALLDSQGRAERQSDEASADDDSLHEFMSIIGPLLDVARGQGATFDWPERVLDRWQAFKTSSGDLRLIFVHLDSIDGSVSGMGARLAELRENITEFLRDRGLTSVKWGVTGIPAIEADETTQSIDDSSRASLLALVLITILMVVVFRGISVPLLATSSLLVGLAWSFGWVVVSVGHLQLLSVIFSVILLGLGIDFALHVVARLELIAHDDDELSQLMPRVFRSVGPGLITGAITTSAAFVAIALTDFRGAAETGIIAGGGIALCLVAVLCTFPSLLSLTGRWKKIIRHREGGEDAHFLVHLLHWVYEHPRSTIVGIVLVCAALGWSARNLRYDPNLLNLYPPGIQSVDWEERLRRDDARSAWAGLVVVQPEEADRTARLLRRVSEVSHVGGAGILVPADWETRVARVDELRQRTIGSLPIPEGFAAMIGLINQVESGLRSAGADLQASEIAEAIAASSGTAPDMEASRWAALNDSFLRAKGELANFVSESLQTRRLSASDLPEALRDRWIGRDGSWVLLAEPYLTDQPILDPQRLERFVTTMRAAVPDVIGPPVQIYESGRLIQSAYAWAAIIALPIILLLLILDFRSVWDSLCAILPVAIGFLGIFGIMGATGMPLNFANMIVMPIVLGVCVDVGVHVVHRWREDPGGKPPGLSGGTGRAICLTMCTTMIGFGSMIIAHHRGIRSLGIVMVIGLLTTLIAGLTVLPAILAMRGRSQEPSEAVD